jgi:hypothetical protein
MNATALPGTPRRALAAVLAGLACLTAPAPSALAQTVPSPLVTPHAAPLVDQQIQESVQRREAFQERHRQQLQQDRDRMGYRPERLEVPVMRPNCTTSVFGSSLSSGCR